MNTGGKNRTMIRQVDDDGNLKHLISLDGIPADLLGTILDRAESYLSGPGSLRNPDKELNGITIANLFFEPSTRTRISFELAAKRLGAHVVNLETGSSSLRKNESLLDTFFTLQAMGVNLFILRHHQPGSCATIAEHANESVGIISAGEGHLSHPTQGLLDVLTMRLHKGDIRNLKVCIIGDIRHSRVARSAAQALATLGVRELFLVGPDRLLPAGQEFPNAVLSNEPDAGLSGADVVMALRIQKERMNDSDIPDGAEYFRRYGLTRERLGKTANGAIVMHPGPMNRNVEIADDVADGNQSVIRQQVTHGVAVRMAVMTLMARR